MAAAAMKPAVAVIPTGSREKSPKLCMARKGYTADGGAQFACVRQRGI
jgi:hypothetical protein